MVRLQSSSRVRGVGPADSTGKSSTTYWPGGTREGSTLRRGRPLKPREMGGIGLQSERGSRCYVGMHEHDNLNRVAVSATLHCLTGCAIGEIVGMIIGTALGLSNTTTIAISIALAFLFGYSLSTLPL